MLYQGPTNSAPPVRGIDEKGIQLRIAVIARHDRGKSHDRSTNLGDKNAAAFDLPERKLNRVAMGEERFAVARKWKAFCARRCTKVLNWVRRLHC